MAQKVSLRNFLGNTGPLNYPTQPLLGVLAVRRKKAHTNKERVEREEEEEEERGD